MEGKKKWEFTLQDPSLDKNIYGKARELVNKVRLILGEGNYEVGTAIWQNEFEELFYRLLDENNPVILYEIDRGFPFEFLKVLEDLKRKSPTAV